MFRSSGWAGLLAEVEMDIKRLARRNLGRDDRYIYTYHTCSVTLKNGALQYDIILFVSFKVHC